MIWIKGIPESAWSQRPPEPFRARKTGKAHSKTLTYSRYAQNDRKMPGRPKMPTCMLSIPQRAAQTLTCIKVAILWPEQYPTAGRHGGRHGAPGICAFVPNMLASAKDQHR
jgi:hypothetical protein